MAKQRIETKGRQGVAAKTKKRAFESVRDAILADIRSGALSPGDKLPSERDLAIRMKVGRHSIREALRTLEMSGVLRFQKGVSGGAFIRDQSSDGLARSIRDMIIVGRMPLRDVMVVRVHLLAQAVELACAAATEADFDAIEQNIELTASAVETGDPIATIEPNLDFNRLLGAASHNLVCAMLLDSVVAIMSDLLYSLKLPTEIDIIAPRRAILAEMRRRNAPEAIHLIRAHYDDTTAYVLAKASLAGHH